MDRLFCLQRAQLLFLICMCPCSIETTAVFSWILRDEPFCGWWMLDVL